jgi:hypothetical protein
VPPPPIARSTYAIVTGLLVGVYAGLVLLATRVLPPTARNAMPTAPVSHIAPTAAEAGGFAGCHPACRAY